MRVAGLTKSLIAVNYGGALARNQMSAPQIVLLVNDQQLTTPLLPMWHAHDLSDRRGDRIGTTFGPGGKPFNTGLMMWICIRGVSTELILQPGRKRGGDD